MATMTAYAAMSRSDAKAQQMVAAAAGKDPVPAQLPVRRFRIAEGPLSAALDQYRQQSGVTLKLELPAETLATFTAHAVVGLYPNDSALRQLLAGTGLSFTFDGPDTVSIGLRHQNPLPSTPAFLTQSP